MIHPDIVRGIGLKKEIQDRQNKIWEQYYRRLFTLQSRTFGQIPITPEWQYKPAPGEEPPKAPVYQPTPTEPLPEYAWGARTLRLTSPYMRGTDIFNLQFALFDLKFFYQKIDGIYGPATAGAVKNYQQARGLTADGIVGPQTWTNLGRDWQGYAEQKYEEAKALYATVPPVKKEAVTKITAGQSTKPAELVEEKAFPWGWVLLIGGLILFVKSKS